MQEVLYDYYVHPNYICWFMYDYNDNKLYNCEYVRNAMKFTYDADIPYL